MRQFLKDNARAIATAAILTCAGAIIAGTAYLSGWTMAEMELRTEDRTITQSSEGGSVLREVQDLAAQNTMALWTMVVGIAAVISLGVTTAGVIAVWRTLEQTRKAVEATSAGTQAMQEAAQQAERIGQAQTRAYISVSGAEYIHEKRDLFIEVRLKNTGQSPARNVDFVATGKVIRLVEGTDDGSRTITGIEQVKARPSPAFISAGSESRVTANLLPMKSALKAERRNLLHISLLIICRWTDVYGEDQQIVFTATTSTHGDLASTGPKPLPERGILNLQPTVEHY